MNVYILVEGRRTEKKLYPEWLAHCVPRLTRVSEPEDAKNNNYYLISANGYPSIVEHAKDAIKTINACHGIFDYFAVVLDSEERGIETTKNIINAAIDDAMPSYTLNRYIIIQNCCIETWLLGNKKIFPRNPKTKEMSDYISHYNVCKNDPEKMPLPTDYTGSLASYHQGYLSTAIKDKTNNRFTYTKNNPAIANRPSFFESLKKRYNEDAHIKSFGVLLDFFDDLNFVISNAEAAQEIATSTATQ